MTGTIHNAKVCTIDGRDLWIACVCEPGFKFRANGLGDIVSEHATLDEARTWLDAELRRRGETTVLIRVDR